MNTLAPRPDRTEPHQNPPCCAILWESNEHSGGGAAVKAMLRLVLEALICNVSTYFSLPSGLFVGKNKIVTLSTKPNRTVKAPGEDPL